MESEIKERLARVETKIDNLCAKIKALDKKFDRLEKHVNDEIVLLSERIENNRLEIESLKFMKKLLGFIGGAAFTALLTFIIYFVLHLL